MLFRSNNRHAVLKAGAASTFSNAVKHNALYATYKCVCAAGWYGVNCTMLVDNCVTRPCANGGTCVNGVNSYECVCAGGWGGMNCTVDVSPCTMSPCANGASCDDIFDSNCVSVIDANDGYQMFGGSTYYQYDNPGNIVSFNVSFGICYWVYRTRMSLREFVFSHGTTESPHRYFHVG